MKNCDSCNKELIPVFTNTPMRRRGDFTAQYENALGISFLLGYGMFDDYIDHGRVPEALVICHDCAHKLIEENPWIAKIVDPKGHSHPKSKGLHDTEGCATDPSPHTFEACACICHERKVSRRVECFCDACSIA